MTEDKREKLFAEYVRQIKASDDEAAWNIAQELWEKGYLEGQKMLARKLTTELRTFTASPAPSDSRQRSPRTP